MFAALVRWSFEPYHDEFMFAYYNNLYYDKFCPASVMEGEDDAAPSTRFNARSHHYVV